MKLLTNDAVRELRRELDALNYIGWYRRIAGDCYERDPWKAFERVRTHAQRHSQERDLFFDLFLLELPVSARDLARLLDSQTIRDLISTGFLTATSQGIVSRYCLLGAFDKYLLVEYPVASYPGLLVSSDTYISSHSYNFVRSAIALLPARKILDLGCGTGLLAIVASESAASVFASELDPSALRLAQANIDLNESAVQTLQADMFTALDDGAFDFVAFNPPWRLVPPGVNYPNPLARVGQGRDGLDQLRSFLHTVPALLSDDGRAAFIIEFPGSNGGFEFEAELKEFTTTSRCSIILNLESPLDVEDQSLASAQTALYLNENLSIDSLCDRFLSHYRRLGFSHLHPCFCEVRNDQQGRMVYLDQRATELSSAEAGTSLSLLPV